jgi:adenosyl cobinamide kinase/adenosyl cobinamide phosphate guanylyltransferase
MIRNVLKQYLVDLDTSWERISYFLHFSDELKKFSKNTSCVIFTSLYLFVQRKIRAM